MNKTTKMTEKLSRAHTVQILDFNSPLRLLLVRLYEHNDQFTLWDLSH